MRGYWKAGQDRLFYSFNLDEHILQNYLLRSIERCLDLMWKRHRLIARRKSSPPRSWSSVWMSVSISRLSASSAIPLTGPRRCSAGRSTRKAIEPHVPVWDKTKRNGGTFSSSDFQWHQEANEYRSGRARLTQQLAFIQESAPTCHEGRHHHLSVKPGRLRGLPDEGTLLPEYAVSQDHPQHS